MPTPILPRILGACTLVLAGRGRGSAQSGPAAVGEAAPISSPATESPPPSLSAGAGIRPRLPSSADPRSGAGAAAAPPEDARAWLVLAAGGAAPRGPVFDPSRGVAFAEYVEDPSGEHPRAGADSVVESATLLCTQTAVLDQVRRALDLGATLGPVTCDRGPPASCTFHGMEGTPAIRIVLREERGRLEIAAITEISEDTTMSPRWVAEARAWTARRISELEKRRCR